MRGIFWGFCRNWFLTLPFGPSDFGFKFAEIFVFEKQLPAITDTGSHRESFFEYEYLREFEAKIGTARNVV